MLYDYFLTFCFCLPSRVVRNKKVEKEMLLCVPCFFTLHYRMLSHSGSYVASHLVRVLQSGNREIILLCMYKLYITSYVA